MFDLQSVKVTWLHTEFQVGRLLLLIPLEMFLSEMPLQLPLRYLLDVVVIASAFLIPRVTSVISYIHPLVEATIMATVYDLHIALHLFLCQFSSGSP